MGMPYRWTGLAGCLRLRAVAVAKARVDIFSRAEISSCSLWARTFVNSRKDYRFYELVEDSICPGFHYRYFGIRDRAGEISAIQPFFILDQDLLLGAGSRMKAFARGVRGIWPRFLVVRTLMVGCAAGEGHLDRTGEPLHCLSEEIVAHARKQGASIIVLKEFPARYRAALACFLAEGFTRVPSLPMTCLNIDYASFDEYMTKALKSATRAKLRKKFRAAERSEPISMEIVIDASAFADELYPLYLQVYNRSKLHFEKLTKVFFSEIGRRMPGKVRFFIWRQRGKIVAFTLCMMESEALYAEYIGLDYSVAFDLHLYHYAVRGMIEWAIANGFKRFRSGGLNYDPKLQMRHLLDPVDLYVRHSSPILNVVLKRILPFLEPTGRHKTLQKFSNYHELWPAR